MNDISLSEEIGIKLIEENDLNILSIGISTALNAEIKMINKNNNSHIIATTINKEGLKQSKQIIKNLHLEDKITLKLEDVTRKMPYQDNFFDFIYARLVLHYLNNQELDFALNEIKRVLKKNGKFYIVVRSDKEWETKLIGTTYDKKTGLTKYPKYDTLNTNNVEYLQRKFFSVNSLTKILNKKGFKIECIREYEEQLYKDYQRKEKVKKPNIVISANVRKKGDN